jgi:hypothetical protein
VCVTFLCSTYEPGMSLPSSLYLRAPGFVTKYPMPKELPKELPPYFPPSSSSLTPPPSASSSWFYHYCIVALLSVVVALTLRHRTLIDSLSLPFMGGTSGPAIHCTLYYAATSTKAGSLEAMTELETRVLFERDFNAALRRGERFMDASSGAYLSTWASVVKAAPAAAVCSDKKASSSTAPSLELLHDRGQELLPFIWPPRAPGHQITLDLGLDDDDEVLRGKGPMTITTLQTSPKAFYIANFLSDAEAEELVAFAQDEKNPYRLRPSTTGHKSWTQGGEKSTNSRRTSLNGFDISSSNGKRIKRRAFQLARIKPYDENMADGIQVLRYAPGQAYVPHTDYFSYRTSSDHNWDPRVGGTNRFATVFLYLSDVAAGGHTVFPKVSEWNESSSGGAAATKLEAAAAPGNSGTDVSDGSPTPPLNLSQSSWEWKLANECETAFSVPPRKGDALLFYSQHPDGELDETSFHGGCPVLEGTKWAANIWIWNGCRYGVCKKLPRKSTAR